MTQQKRSSPKRTARVDTKRELTVVAEALDKQPIGGEKRLELLRRQADLGDLRDERIEDARKSGR